MITLEYQFSGALVRICVVLPSQDQGRSPYLATFQGTWSKIDKLGFDKTHPKMVVYIVYSL